MNGFLNVLKPPGMSSHDVVSFFRRKHEVKTGHTGTLDPAAAGVLVLAIGKGTKLASFVSSTKKSYRVELTLGKSTDTGDIAGKLVDEQEVPLLNTAAIDRATKKFVRTQKQKPPLYSAVHYKGKRLYDLVRKGIEVDPPLRTITIYSITIIRVTPSSLLFDVECSSGTYMRVLCADLAKTLGTVGFMSFLIRTRVGQFDIKTSCLLEEIDSLTREELLDKFLHPLDYPLSHLPSLVLEKKDVQKISNGNFIRIPAKSILFESDIVRLYDKNTIIGLGKIQRKLQITADETVIKPETVFV